jgi:Ca-activated chloride channel family protein
MFEQEAEGIDIMLVLDISFSMEATDLIKDGKPASRFEVVRDIVGEFIERREFDRVGVIGFAKETYLISPLTLDKNWVRQCMEYVEFGGGTNIGGGMDAATRFLSTSESSTRIAILLTDGGQTTGTDPSEAIPRAKEAGIRFYTAAIVSPRRNNPEAAAKDPLGVVARETGGQFFMASDSDALRAIYQQIDKMESTKFRQNRTSAYQDLFPWLVIPAFALLVGGGLYRQFIRKEMP